MYQKMAEKKVKEEKKAEEEKEAEDLEEKEGRAAKEDGVLEKEVGEREIPPEVKRELDKLRTKLQSFQKNILKRFPFVSSIGLLPPQASKIIEEEEEIEKEIEKSKEGKGKEGEEKLMHLLILLPDEKEKEAPKVKVEAIKLTQAIKPRIWIHIKTIKQIWELCLDSKYEVVDAIAMSFPLYDKGPLGALRVTSIHKTLVLKKFEHYIVSYVIAGSIVRGQATKTSDLDVFVIIDDTDVKRMTRVELREKLRAIIIRYAFEACDIAGVKNTLHPQIYILTEFWESVRDANPVIFTFIRDGVPLYDRGTFIPWRLLLQMGKITGTPEAVERFITMGAKIAEDVKLKLNDIVVSDLYYSILMPSQGVLMLYGLAPPTPKETVELMRKVFVEKEKLLEAKYVEIVEKVFTLYKQFEHEKIKSISGKEIDTLIEQAEEYHKRLKKLVEEVEKKVGEKTILKLYEDMIPLVESVVGKGGEQELVKKFESDIIKKGKLPRASLTTLQEVIRAKKDYAKGKLGRSEIDRVRRGAQELMALLTEYTQRRELLEAEKIRFSTKIGGHDGELYLFGNTAFVIPNLKEVEIKKIDLEKDSIGKAERNELDEAIRKAPKKGKLTPAFLSKIEKLLGEKMEIIL